MDFHLSEGQRLLKSTAGTIATEKFDEDAFTWQGEYPHENVDVLVEHGLLGISLPEEYGGGGSTIVEVLLAQEAVGRVCPDTAHVLSRSSMGASRIIGKLGSEYLMEKYLPAVCAGESVMSVAISEAGAGSDAAAIQTTAEYDGDQILIDGHKMWVTKATVADAYLVYVKFNDHIGAVVVDANAPGLTVEVEGYTNMYGGDQSVLRFDRCQIPVEHELTVGNEGLKNLLTEFNIERCHNAMMCVACGLNAFDKAMAHAKNREQFGTPIADFQGIEWKFADMATKLDAARLLIYRAAANSVHDKPSRLETSMAKVFANEIGQAVIDEALQIHGASGYMQGHPLEYLYRLVRGWKIAGGTVEVHRNGIADQLKTHGFD